MEEDDLTQLTLLDPGYVQREAELWERERRLTKVGRPRKGEERKREAAGVGEEGVSGGRMNGATAAGPVQRVGRRPVSEGRSFDTEAVTGLRVARSAVVAALKRTLGRIRSPERWTPLHVAASKQEHRTDLCWWGRWPAPESPMAVKWSALGAVIATTPDTQTQRLASAALRGVGPVETGQGHAATLQFIQERIEAVGRIEAAYVTRADILAAVARPPVAGRGREDE